MGHQLTERRVSLGALSITVLAAGLWGCVGGDAEDVSDDGAAVLARGQPIERVQTAGALVIPMDTTYQDRGVIKAELAPEVHLTQDAPVEVSGNDLTFRAAWDNTGSTSARSGVLQIAIPGGTTLVSASDDGVVNGGVVSWTLGNLLPSMTGEVSLTVRAAGPGSYLAAAELNYRVGRTPRVVRSRQIVQLGDQDDPPETTIVSGPLASSEDPSATFVFESDDAAATFECSLDGGAFAACTTPLSLDEVTVGVHWFVVRAVDVVGQVDATPPGYEWTVLPPNQLPVANDDEASVNEDGEVLIAVRGNDGGGDDPVLLAEVSAPQHGSAAIVNDEVRYVPSPDFTGSDTFTYTLRDGNGDLATATVTVTVVSVNDTPTAVLDSFLLLEDSGTTVLDLLANDTGLGDRPITFVSLGAPMNGVLERVGAEVRYTPNPNFTGSDVILYTIRDADGEQSSSVAFLNITQVNDEPVARDDAFTVAAGTTTELDVLQNDTDPDGNGLTITSLSAPAIGTVALSFNKARFTAPADASGVTTFTYVISDGQGAFATATVTVAIE